MSDAEQSSQSPEAEATPEDKTTPKPETTEPDLEKDADSTDVESKDAELAEPLE